MPGWRAASTPTPSPRFSSDAARRAGAEGFQYSLIVTDTPPARGLRNFLLARRR